MVFVNTGQPDGRWNDDHRCRIPTERLDRNEAILLQKLRVTQTGIQVLTGFLLVLPFQSRFPELGEVMRLVYLGTVICSVGATILLIAPVGMHRVLFRRRRLGTLVNTAHRTAIVGLLLLGGTLAGVASLIFYLVVGAVASAVAGAGTAAAFLWFWIIVPMFQRRSSGDAGTGP